MPFVKAGPNQFLLAGRGGKLENLGSAVRPYLRPGTIHVLVPGTKQEATFEFTQETRDGIPLRFKGIVIYRITDPIAAARLFDFGTDAGVARITALLTHVCLGELRHAVSHMTMVECIEQRKTTLSEVAGQALQATIHGSDDDEGAWGITVEVAQLAQVFIVDSELRAQLEAEVRNEIKLKSDQSNVHTKEETRLTEMASEGRLQEQQLAGDQEDLRRQEALDMARLARERRMLAENLAAEQERVTTQAPVRRLAIETERDLLREELELRRLQQDVKAFDVETELLLPRAQQAMRREMLPLEQAPQIVESASKVLHGTNLSIYGEDGQLLGQLAPVFEILAGAVQRATAGATTPGSESSAPESSALES